MNEIIKQNKPLCVALERNEDSESGRSQYCVIVDGETVESTPVLALAEAVYREQCEEKAAPARARLAREKAHRDIQGVRADAFERRANLGRAQGGRGGRGGV